MLCVERGPGWRGAVAHSNVLEGGAENVAGLVIRDGRGGIEELLTESFKQGERAPTFELHDVCWHSESDGKRPENEAALGRPGLTAPCKYG